jgi:hypothetical protein
MTHRKFRSLLTRAHPFSFGNKHILLRILRIAVAFSQSHDQAHEPDAWDRTAPWWFTAVAAGVRGVRVC